MGKKDIERRLSRLLHRFFFGNVSCAGEAGIEQFTHSAIASVVVGKKRNV
jgi:hypothetical protein